MRRRRPRVAAAVFLGATLALSGCGDDNGDQATPSPTIAVGGEAVAVERLRDAAAALCTARDQARADVKQARDTFYDRSHDDLHTISRALDAVDRAQSARLLEDKQRVESDLERNAPGSELSADLDRLAGVTRSGLATLSVTVPPCS
ncbi:MAG: hypothetical protein ABR540_11480 [Acidimicrobiales bacterium]